MHCMAKIFSKLLANRLAPSLDALVFSCQSAFIKKRCIQDNFLYTQNLVRCLHQAKIPSLFLKLDIAKAFNLLSWGYLFEVLSVLGFGHKWREWILILFGMTSSHVIMNGTTGTGFPHRRGVRQGEPLSLMLFILSIEPLQRLLHLATQRGVLSPLPSLAAKLQTSLYTNDTAIFLNLVPAEFHLL